MYYKAIQQALANGKQFHLVAILWRGKTPIRIGINGTKSHPRALRRFLNGSEVAHMHAEMHALVGARPGDVLEVLRIKKNHEITMAKPCYLCQKWIKQSGIKEVRYTDWNGNWQELN